MAPVSLAQRYHGDAKVKRFGKMNTAITGPSVSFGEIKGRFHRRRVLEYLSFCCSQKNADEVLEESHDAESSLDWLRLFIFCLIRDVLTTVLVLDGTLLMILRDSNDVFFHPFLIKFRYDRN